MAGAAASDPGFTGRIDEVRYAFEKHDTREDTTVRRIRGFLLGLFVFGAGGTGIELLLLGHTEDFWQLLPLGLMGVGGAALAWYSATGGAPSLRLFRRTMGAVVVSGVVGLWLHYQGNAEFEREMYPSLQGLALFWEAIRGATPTLAPGTMLELGLLGLAYTYRHPVLARSRDEQEKPEGEDTWTRSKLSRLW